MAKLISAAPVDSQGPLITVGAQTITLCQFNLDSPQVTSLLQNCLVDAEFLALGQRQDNNQGGRARLSRGYKTLAGVLSSLGAVEKLIGGVQVGDTVPLLGEAGILSATASLDLSGSVIRGRVTGVAGVNVAWTGYLWIATGAFVES